MNGILKLLMDQGLLFPVQAIILAINGYMILKGKTNEYLSLSSLLIISTFVLQMVRRRFLLLYPRNSWIGRESSEIDTYYLRAIIILSACFALVGSLSAYLGLVSEPGIFRKSWLPLIALIVIGVIPCVFWILSDYIDGRIAAKLKGYEPKIELIGCPCCDYPFAVQKNEVIHKNLGRITFECEHCNNEVVREVTLNIGE